MRSNRAINIILITFSGLFIFLLFWKFFLLENQANDDLSSAPIVPEEVIFSLNQKLDEYLIDDLYIPNIANDILYCYVGSAECSSCIESTLIDFIDLHKIIGDEHIGILGNFEDSSKRDLYALKYSLGHVYQAEKDFVDQLASVNCELVFFYLDSCNYTRDSFRPIYDHSYNIKYFKRIIEKRNFNKAINSNNKP